MARIGIILGSTRPNRNREQVARWVLEIATQVASWSAALAPLREATAAA